MAVALAAFSAILLRLIWVLAAENDRLAPSAFFYVGAALFLGALLYLVIRQLRNPRSSVKAWVYPLAAGGITLFLLLLTYLFIGIYPFGSRSLFISDSYVQYFPMYAQYQRLLQGEGGNLLHTLNAGFGMNMMSAFGYYLSSPFGLLLALFPKDGIAEFFMLSIAVKTILSAVSFAFCIQYLTGRRDWSVPVTAVMYATCMFMIAFSWNVMWLDAVYALPLAVLAFERMMRTGRKAAYILLITYLMLSNYYTGYMACLFMALYFAFWCFQHRLRGKALLLSFARMAWTSVLGVLMASAILLPVFFGLQSTSAIDDVSHGWKANYPLLELFQRMFFGAEPSVINEPFANIGAGTLSLLAIPLYATSSGIPLRRRLARLGLFLCMVLSIALSEPNLLWHGGHYPNGLPYRYAFIFVFAQLLIVGDLLANLRAVRPRQLLAVLGCVLLYVFLSEAIGTSEGADTEYAYSLSFVSIYATAGFVCLYALAFALARRHRAAVCSLILFFAVSESLIGGIYTRAGFIDLYKERGVIAGDESTQLLSDTVKQVEGENTSSDFYRISKVSSFTHNDGMLFGYPSYDVFASTYSHAATRLANALGMSGNKINSQGSMCFMPTIDSLLGVRYFLLGSEVKDVMGLVQSGAVHGEDASLYAYENRYVLPLGFMGTKALRDWGATDYDPVATQNTFYQALTGGEGSVLRNAAEISVGSGDAFLSSKDTGTAISLLGSGSLARFIVEATEAGRMYLYVDCTAASSIQINMTNGSVHTIPEGKAYFIDIGIMQVGDIATVTIGYDGDVYPNGIIGNLYTVAVDEAQFAADVDLLRAGGLVISDYAEGSITGTVHAPQDGVFMTTIAYDKGWTVQVDGAAVEAFGVGDGAWLAVEMPAGDHEVVMHFWPQGLSLGLVVSLVSVAAYIVIVIVERRKRTVVKA